MFIFIFYYLVCDNCYFAFNSHKFFGAWGVFLVLFFCLFVCLLASLLAKIFLRHQKEMVEKVLRNSVDDESIRF